MNGPQEQDGELAHASRLPAKSLAVKSLRRVTSQVPRSANLESPISLANSFRQENNRYSLGKQRQASSAGGKRQQKEQKRKTTRGGVPGHWPSNSSSLSDSVYALAQLIRSKEDNTLSANAYQASRLEQP